MFSRAEVSINDRLRLLNLINDGGLGERFVSNMKDTDVLFIRIAVNSFPSDINVDVGTADEIRQMESSSENIVKSFNRIFNERTKDSITVHIHYETITIQTSTFNLPKAFFYDENIVLGQLTDENTYYTTERLERLAKEVIDENKEIFDKNLRSLDENQNIVIEASLLGEVSCSIINKDHLQKYCNKRFVDVDISSPVFIMRDGYRFHGINVKI